MGSVIKRYNRTRKRAARVRERAIRQQLIASTEPNKVHRRCTKRVMRASHKARRRFDRALIEEALEDHERGI